MNAKNENLRTELATHIKDIMLAYEAMAKMANIFKDIQDRYQQLGFSSDEIYDLAIEIASTNHPEIYNRINKIEDPNLEQALTMEY